MHLNLPHTPTSPVKHLMSTRGFLPHFPPPSQLVSQQCRTTIITARKLSLGQGTVFTGVCLSARGGGIGFPACITGHMTRGWGLHPGWGWGRRSASRVGGLPPGGGCIGGGQIPPPRKLRGILWDTSTSRRYAS